MGCEELLLYMVSDEAPESVSDYGASARGTSFVWPYAESKKTAPTVPKPFTLLEAKVRPGLRFVVFEGAS